MGLIVRSNIKKVVKELDKENSVSSVAEEVGTALEKKAEDIIKEGIKRAKANGRRTLQARDLWDFIFKMLKKKTNKSRQGRLSRARGKRFELKVRVHLEKEEWIIDKWTNNINLEKQELVKVKNLFRGLKIPMMLGAGFPDFIGFRLKSKKYEVIGIEAKGNGLLDKQEKEKCRWYLQKKIFSQIWIAKEGKKRGEIEYIDFEKKYNKT